MKNANSNPKLVDLDHLIDSQIPVQALCAISLDSAVNELLSLNDLYVFAQLPESIKANKESDEAISVAQLVIQDTHKFCLKWIYEHCQISTEADPDLVKRTLVGLYEFAREYSGVHTVMTALHKSLLKHEILADGTIKINHLSATQQAIRYTDSLLSGKSYITPKKQRASEIVDSAAEHQRLQQNLQTALNSSTINLAFSKRKFAKLVQANLKVLEFSWELDKSWNFGDYSLAELKQIWAVVKARSQLQVGIFIPLYLATRNPLVLRKIPLAQSHDQWAIEISQYSGVSLQKVQCALKDLTFCKNSSFDSSPWNSPFLQVSNGILLLNNTYVHFCNPENDAWLALSKRDRSIHGRLNPLKEEIWINQLRPWLNSLGYTVFGPLKFAQSGKKFDLDLLLLSERESFGFVCELKWPATPNSISREESIKQEFAKGREQSLRALEWIKANHLQLKPQIGEFANRLSSYELQPLVISKTMIDSSGDMNQAPTINEFLLRSALDAPVKVTLRKFWQIVKNRSYIARDGIHYRTIHWTASCGNVKFQSDSTTCVPLRDWSPTTDLCITSTV